MRRTACILPMILALAPAVAVAQTAQPRPDGFWKEVAKGHVKGEFDGEDPIGLAAGKHIPTNCAIHRPTDDGKTYCFASLPSLEFLSSNPELLAKAQAFWAKEHPRTTAH